MGMLRRGNRDSLLTDRSNYERILRKYDHPENENDREEGEEIVVVFVISTCIILTIGALLSILDSLKH